MQIHWLSLTVHAPSECASQFYDLWLRDAFGQSIPGGGGMFYTGSMTGLLGVRLFVNPLDNRGDYWTLVMPGQACEAVSLEWFDALGQFLKGYYPYNCTRLDLAFDDFPFSPDEMLYAEEQGLVSSPARPRGVLKRRDEFHRGHDGSTWAIGSRAGGRFLRVYDRRGCNRLELELHGKHSQQAFTDLFRVSVVNSTTALTFDVSGALVASRAAQYWLESEEVARGFVEAFLRVRKGRLYDHMYALWLSNRTILDTRKFTPARDVVLEKADKWLVSQVSVMLSVLQDLCGRDYITRLLCEGYLRRDRVPEREARYQALLDFADCFPASHRGELLPNRTKVNTTLLIGGV